jgi:hypothetical protein
LEVHEQVVEHRLVCLGHVRIDPHVVRNLAQFDDAFIDAASTLGLGHLRHANRPQALVTIDAVKFKAMGMFTIDHMGSTFCGLLDGTEPAS